MHAGELYEVNSHLDAALASVFTIADLARKMVGDVVKCVHGDVVRDD